VVEIGAGTADLSVELAQQERGTHFVAVDVKADRLYTGAKFALEHNLDALAFVRAHADQLPAIFVPGSVSELWITFPDPFPRKRQAKHRLTHPHFLHIYQTLLVPGGTVHFKTDNRELFLWSLEQIVATGWSITELTLDLHQSNLPESYKITTFYERKFLTQGLPINYVQFLPPE
jgi:tRNA (guanine-N7-)-methyltransferase